MNNHEFKKIRIDLGFVNPTEFGEFMGLSHMAIYNYESGKSIIKKPMVILMKLLSESKRSRINQVNKYLIASEFKRIRIDLGYSTPYSFAEALDLTHKTIYNYENGTNLIKKPLSMMMQLLEYVPKTKLKDYL